MLFNSTYEFNTEKRYPKLLTVIQVAHADVDEYWATCYIIWVIYPVIKLSLF